ncbi:MAG: XRE family transcriptional regulator [Verrucomicrobia bacterium]|nr:XRE family transcriptional regulator [Verrucomicrobiota bacterium]
MSADMSQVMAFRAKKTLATAIKRKLSAEQMSISAFAKKIKTGRQSIRRLLDGKNTAITLNTMAKAADALNLEFEISVKPLPLSRLEPIAKKYAETSDEKEAARLEKEFLEGYYGKPFRHA